ncbi:hypothetical protein BurMR1_0757 [Burkholderia sp. MR1]|nr:hypothetical protein BurMR1_0757 [Burkholderia sp. MR1]
MNTMTPVGGFRKRLKRRVKWPLIAIVAALPDSVQTLLYLPRVRKFAQHVPVLKVVYTGCYRTHPLDKELGTETGGVEPPEAIYGDDKNAGSFPYMGSQPSTVRLALRQLGDLRDHAFVDIGCGKGRPMIVATEFPFREIIGYDLASRLVDIANRNARIVARRFPERVPMRAYAADALQADFPPGKLVVYLFNPFGIQTMAQLLDSLTAAYERGAIEALSIVYLNPLCKELFDASPILDCRFSASVPYAADEIGYDEGVTQSVRIWTTRPRA